MPKVRKNMTYFHVLYKYEMFYGKHPVKRSRMKKLGWGQVFIKYGTMTTRLGHSIPRTCAALDHNPRAEWLMYLTKAHDTLYTTIEECFYAQIAFANDYSKITSTPWTEQHLNHFAWKCQF